MKFRDRIREFRRVPAGELIPNPRNWREHSTEQANALRALLAEVGFAGAVLAREIEGGRLQLIDGHLRTETVGADASVPVLVLDVTEAEADKILATFDPLAAMAETNQAMLDDLLRDVETDSAALRDLLDELGGSEPEAKAAEGGGEGATVEHDQAIQLRPRREYVVIMADSESDLEYLRRVLNLQMVRRGGYKAGSAFDAVSAERVITAARFRGAVDALRDSK
jgi:ParB-like chromosome segregation protein Spo0J